MKRKRRHSRQDDTSSNSKTKCCFNGCTQPGEYKAPLSPQQLNAYQWFCLDHIREYNQRWNYFADMDSLEIEEFVKDSVTGHRPTWSREAHIQHQSEKLFKALHDFLHRGRSSPKETSPLLRPELRKALALMDMEHPFTVKNLKIQYRQMVKKYHPDANKGSKYHEERFKEITAAYMYLYDYIENNS